MTEAGHNGKSQEPLATRTNGAWVAMIFLALFGTALFVRTVGLHELPPGDWYDEAINGLDALGIVSDISEGRRPPIFFTTEGHPREPMFLYLVAATFKLCGVSTWSLRFPSAVIGSLTVGVFWLMLRRLRGGEVATVAAIALIFFRWHLHFSRASFRTILAPLFICLTIWAILRAMETRRAKRDTTNGERVSTTYASSPTIHDPRHTIHCLLNWALAGLFLGAGFYTYLSFRFVPVLLALWALAGAWASWRSQRRRPAAQRRTRIAECGTRNPRQYTIHDSRSTIHDSRSTTHDPRSTTHDPRLWKGVLVMLAVAIMVFLPLGMDYIRNPFHFMGRVGEVNLFDKGLAPGLRAIAGNAIGNAVQFYVPGCGDYVGKHNIPYRAVFDPLSSLFFLIGLIYCGFRISDCGLRNAERGINNDALITIHDPRSTIPFPSAVLALSWLVLMLMGSVLSFGAPNLLRTVAATPAVIWIWAEGLLAASQWIARLAKRPNSAPLQWTVAALFLLWFSASQAYDYFAVFPKAETVWENFNTGETEVGRFVKALDERREIAFVGQLILNHPTVRFESTSRDGTSSRAVRVLALPAAFASDPQSPPRDHLVLATMYNNLLPELQRLFPDGQVAREFTTPDGGAWALLYRIPANQLLDTEAALRATGQPRTIRD